MIINHNLNAMNATRMMNINNDNAAKSMEKLSSGLRINRAGDDAAGLAISEKMRGQIRGLDQASRNAQDGISLIQTAEGALNETHSILQRMRELAVQASSDTNNSSDRGQIQKELDQLTSEINRIGNTTEFNTMKLLNGDISAKKGTGKFSMAVIDQNVNISGQLGVASTSGGTWNTKINVTTATSDFNWTDVVSASITLTKVSSTHSLQVKFNAKESSTVATLNSFSLTVADTIDTTNISGDITYNAHGVNFSLSKSDFDSLKASSTVTINLITAQQITANGSTHGSVLGTYAMKNDFAANSAGATISSGITVNAAAINPNARSLVISATGSGAITVMMFSSNVSVSAVSSGVTATAIGGPSAAISKFVITADAAASGQGGFSVYKFNNNGVSFEITQKNKTASFSTNIINLDTKDVEKTKDASLQFQVGANQDQSMALSITDMRSQALGLTTTQANVSGFSKTMTVTNGTDNTDIQYSLDVSTQTGAENAITAIQGAIDKVSDERAKLGATQNRLEHTIANLGTSSENLQAAESRIRDVDMATEMMNYSKNNILSQAAQAMLAQANQQPQNVLQLLR